MPNRLYELVALGPELLAEAKRRGKGVNESHMLVHHVLSRAFKEDLTSIPSGALRAHLASKLTQTIECRTA